MEKRSKEHIQENIKLLKSALEGYKEEFSFVERLRDRYLDKYDEDRENQTIADALTCYMSELQEEIKQFSSVLKREKETLEKENKN